MNKQIEQAYKDRPRSTVYQIVVSVIVVALIVWSGSAVEFTGGGANGGQIALNILKGIFHPDPKLLFNFTMQGVPYLLLETVCIAFLGTLVAFVYGLMFIRVSGPGAFTGLLTMSVCSIGMVSKMYIEAIEDLDIRILESLDACGCNTMQKIRYGILPQLIPNFASTVIYRFDINLRDATVLGLVGAGGIGAPLIFAMNSYRWNEAGAILVGLIVLVLIVEYISTRIRVKLTRG